MRRGRDCLGDSMRPENIMRFESSGVSEDESRVRVPYLQCHLLTQAKRLHPEFQNQTRHSGYICHNQFESRNGLSGEILSTDLVMSIQSAACKVEIQWVEQR